MYISDFDEYMSDRPPIVADISLNEDSDESDSDSEASSNEESSR